MPKTLQDIDALKANWLQDPCWDIEDTEGFEYWHDYLKAWRENREAMARQAEQDRLTASAAAFGCTVALVQYIEALERRIKRLEADRHDAE
jgi:hypothetical protein